MSQREIIVYLKKHKDKWFSVNQLRKVMGGVNNTGNACKILRQHNMVLFEKKHRTKAPKTGYLVYKYKP